MYSEEWYSTFRRPQGTYDFSAQREDVQKYTHPCKNGKATNGFLM